MENNGAKDSKTKKKTSFGGRRRRVDPTTCERDYSCDEVEFMNALEQYKHQTGRKFPTCGEILEVVRSLGYRKAEAASVGGEPAGAL
ncbi:MAG: hypothetical protein IJH68_05480 [Thermoguttaceae bacterium]|nr:hypothetical protein [Thermoguttaceae bacterium]